MFGCEMWRVCGWLKEAALAWFDLIWIFSPLFSLLSLSFFFLREVERGGFQAGFRSRTCIVSGTAFF